MCCRRLHDHHSLFIAATQWRYYCHSAASPTLKGTLFEAFFVEDWLFGQDKLKNQRKKAVIMRHAQSAAVIILWLFPLIKVVCIEAFGTTSIRSTFRVSTRKSHQLSAAVALTSLAMMNATSTDMPKDTVNTAVAFDADQWQEYETTVQAVLDNGRMVKRKDKAEDVSRAVDYLLTNKSVLPAPSFQQLSASFDCRDRMNAQKLLFLSKFNLTEAQHELAMRTLTYLGDYCAKKRTPTPLLVAWQKLKEGGMVPRENCISTYMYVLSLDNTTSETTAQVATFHDLIYKPNEKTITLRIKSMIANNDAAGAQELLRSSVGNGEWKKLRTYTPVLELYCKQGDMASALVLYRQMQELSRVHFEPDTYALLIGALAEQGYFARDSAPISGAEKLGFSVSSGPGLLDELAAEMAADILELNNASARVLYNGFVKGFASESVLLGKDGEIPVDNTPAKDSELAIGRVSLHDNTAICPKTRAKLQLFQLDDVQRRSVHDTLMEMAGFQYQKFTAELEARFKQNMQELDGKDYAVRELTRFSDWLNEREGEPFTAIVDGPNVAYFGHGKVHYSQVKFVLEELERMGERPLVVMPQKYTAPKFNVNYGVQQELSERDLDVLKDLNETGKLYTVPFKCLDDYYWMLASTSNQTKAAGEGGNMNVPIIESNGRFPGLRPMLVTNDQMRDHRWDLLEPRLFRRWCSCHIVNYSFSEFVEDEWAGREVDFCAADFFSNEIQGNPAQACEIDSATGLAWHFPVSGWDEHDRLCIRLPLI